DIDRGDVLDGHRDAVLLGQNNVLDVLDSMPLGQIGRTAAVDQADAADVHRLLADVDGAAAHIGIGVSNGGGELRQRDALGIEPVQIDLNLILLGGASPGVDLDDARN